MSWATPEFLTCDRLTTINPTGTTSDTTYTFDVLGRFKSRAVNGVTDTNCCRGSKP